MLKKMCYIVFPDRGHPGIVYEDFNKAWELYHSLDTVDVFEHVYEQGEHVPDNRKYYRINRVVYDNYDDALEALRAHPFRINMYHVMHCDQNDCGCPEVYENKIEEVTFVPKE